jgi:hypothetical protein
MRAKRRPEHQQDHSEAQAGRGDLAGRQAARDQHRRDRLHRLHGDRQPIEQPGRDVADAEAREDADRSEARHSDRAEHVRQERAEVAKRAADFAGNPSTLQLPSTRAGAPIVAAAAHGSILRDLRVAVQIASLTTFGPNAM